MSVPKRVLIAVNNERIERILQMNLDRAGYSTIIAKSGLEALEAIQDPGSTISLAIITIGLPKLHGLLVIEETQKDQRVKGLPFILLANIVDEFQDWVKALANGIVYIHEVPIMPRDIMTQIATILAVKELPAEDPGGEPTTNPRRWPMYGGEWKPPARQPLLKGVA